MLPTYHSPRHISRTTESYQSEHRTTALHTCSAAARPPTRRITIVSLPFSPPFPLVHLDLQTDLMRCIYVVLAVPSGYPKTASCPTDRLPNTHSLGQRDNSQLGGVYSSFHTSFPASDPSEIAYMNPFIVLHACSAQSRQACVTPVQPDPQITLYQGHARITHLIQGVAHQHGERTQG